MIYIACVDLNWGIGRNNKLLIKIPEDMKFFKEKTEGHTIVMGRRTAESLGNPLPKRKNIVLTHTINSKNNLKGFHLTTDINEIIEQDKNEELFIIGGAQIYKIFLEYCSKAYITQVFKDLTPDTYILNFNRSKDFSLIEQSETKQYNNLSYCFRTYIRK